MGLGAYSGGGQFPGRSRDLEGAGFGELAASSADSGTEIWGLSELQRKRGSLILHPLPPPLLILHFFRFPLLGKFYPRSLLL